jgi:hypothetical protein
VTLWKRPSPKGRFLFAEGYPDLWFIVEAQYVLGPHDMRIAPVLDCICGKLVDQDWPAVLQAQLLRSLAATARYFM